jgi:hypothetical protein
VAALPIKHFEFMRNDVNKRHLIAAGTSAGVNTPICHNTNATTITAPAQSHLFLKFISFPPG